MSDEAQPVDAAFDYYFGGCDECGCPGTYVIHDEADHYNVCEPCGTYWYIGSNLLSIWEELGEEEWEHARRRLMVLREVEGKIPEWALQVFHSLK